MLCLPISPLHPNYISYQGQLTTLNLKDLSHRRRISANILMLKILWGDLRVPSAKTIITIITSDPRAIQALWIIFEIIVLREVLSSTLL